MTRRMLINAQIPQELRIAIVNDSILEHYQTQVAERGLTRGNIYRGTVAAVQPSLNATFIEYGAERHGFLAIQDVVPPAYHKQPKEGSRRRIEDVLEKGKSVLVQVTKEPEGQKGAAVTTSLSLAGRYLVLTPFEDTRGVSRKVEDDDVRKRLKAQASKLDVPSGCGIIVRTNALDQTKTTLNRDLNALLRIWKRVIAAGEAATSSKLLYNDQDLILQSLRDHLDASIEETLIDDDDAFAKASEYVRFFMPRSKTKLVRYTARPPLFSQYSLDAQIDSIHDRAVSLPGGGSIVIDPTEALTAIDVNSGKGNRSASQEETALTTNLEAATEVARQLRLRDIGGLLVVDFIDMRSYKSQRKVEKTLRDAMKVDKARFSVGKISSNGLLEINRQRLQQALHLRTHRPCPTCQGAGRIASPELVGLGLLRRIETRATTSSIRGVRIALHPELADAVQNGRRQEIAALEKEFDIRVEVTAAARLHRADQELQWFKREPEQLPEEVAQSSEREADESTDKRARRRRRGRRRSQPQSDAPPARADELDADASLEAQSDSQPSNVDDATESPVPRSLRRPTPSIVTPPIGALWPAGELVDLEPPEGLDGEEEPAAAKDSDERPARPRRRRYRRRPRKKAATAPSAP